MIVKVKYTQDSSLIKIYETTIQFHRTAHLGPVEWFEGNFEIGQPGTHEGLDFNWVGSEDMLLRASGSLCLWRFINRKLLMFSLLLDLIGCVSVSNVRTCR